MERGVSSSLEEKRQERKMKTGDESECDDKKILQKTKELRGNPEHHRL